MPSRTDQLHSHQFLRQRAVGALAMRDPDLPSPPGRRVLTALFAGAMLALLALAAVGVYGMLRPKSGDGWKRGTAVIVESETGTRLILRDGVLHPVLNYASARLALGAAAAKTVSVAREDLAGTPRGATIGIAGAPDLLPKRGNLTTAAWTVCSRGSGPRLTGVVFVGTGPAVAPKPLGTDGLLVADPAGRRYLVWQGRRHPIDDKRVLPALDWTRATATPIAAAALNTLAPGARLAPIELPRAGQKSTMPGARVGHLYTVTGTTGGQQYAVALADRLASITPLEADLLGATNQQAGPTPLTGTEYSDRQPRPLREKAPDDPPDEKPKLATVPAGGGICATVGGRDPAGPPEVGVSGETPAAAHEVPGDGTRPAVVVAPNTGALISTMDSSVDQLALVTESGRRYPVPTPQTLTALDYAGAPVTRLPSRVITLLDTGPTLDATEALRPAR